MKTLPALFSLGLASAAIAQDRPNIVLIVADYLGWSDIGCYGAVQIKTPNIDRIAREGTLFTQFYNTVKCTTTRASLLTGLYPRQGGRGIELFPLLELGRITRRTQGRLENRLGWQVKCLGTLRPFHRQDGINNLAARQPDRVKEMGGKWDAWGSPQKWANSYRMDGHPCFSKFLQQTRPQIRNWKTAASGRCSRPA